MVECKICKKEYKDIRMLAWHISSIHKDITSLDYSVKYFYNSIRPTCKCNCGEFTRLKSLGKFVKFKSGHNTRIKDKAFTFNPTLKERQKIYKKRYDKNGIWNNPKKHDDYFFHCKWCNNEFKTDASHKSKVFCNMKCYAEYKKHNIKNKTLDGIMFFKGCSRGGSNSNPGRNGTKPELLYKKYLEKSNIKYEYQKTITLKNSYVSVDFYIPNKNLIVEIDGDYWHCNPKKFNRNYFHTKIKKYAHEIWKKDSIRDIELTNLGYNVERIYESDLNKAIT